MMEILFLAMPVIDIVVMLVRLVGMAYSTVMKGSIVVSGMMGEASWEVWELWKELGCFLIRERRIFRREARRLAKNGTREEEWGRRECGLLWSFIEDEMT